MASVPSPFDSLPEECVSYIISFTSPRDACVFASVSKTFESAAKSDILWEKFLPPGNSSLVTRSRDFSSTKKLYFSLCDRPVRIDYGRMSFWFDKGSGKKSVMLSARGCIPRYWQRIQARFEFRGRLSTGFLSPKTCYLVYIVFKKGSLCFVFDDVAIEARIVLVGREISRRSISFNVVATEEERRGRRYICRNLVKPEKRKDGSMEIEIGEFFNVGGSTEEIEMSVLETTLRNTKSGLIIQGIEFHPSKFG